MPTTVQVGDDTVTFPDGMSEEAMKAALDKEYGGSKNVIANPEHRVLKPDQGLGLKLGLKRPLDNIGVWLDKLPGYNAYDRFMESRGLMRPPEARVEDTARMVEDAAKQGKRPGIIGQMVGSTAMSLPILAATRNPWLTGALQGAADTKNPNNAAGVAADAGFGAATGGLADIGARQLGAAIAPRFHPFVQRLLNEGVELTPGQIMGGLTHRLEDASRSIYGIGDLIIGAQNRATGSLNRAAVQRTLEPLGVRIPQGMEPGHEQIGFAQRTLGDAYNDVLADVDRMAAPTGSRLPVPPGGGAPIGIHLDRPFATEVANLRRLVQGMPEDQRHVFEAFLQNEQHAFNPANGHISGRAMKDLDSLIGQNYQQFRSSPNPHDRRLAQAFHELQFQLRDMVGRQFPQHQQTLNAVNHGWAQLAKLEPIAAAAPSGRFSAQALRAGVVNADTSARHRTAARGEAMMQDLSNAADHVMKPTMGDSGTIQRGIASAAAAYALFSKASPLHVNPWMMGLLGTASAPYLNRQMGNLARNLMTRRPPGAAQVRGMINSLRPITNRAAVGARDAQ